MKNFIRISLSGIIILVLSACNLFPGNSALPGPSVVKLTVQTQNGVTTFSTLGQVVNYNYVITNTGTAPLAGPVIIADPPRIVSCPEVMTVGNLDIYLDLNETITCTAAYTISQSDINNASVINIATATVGGVISNQSGLTLTLAPVSATLTLTKTANPTSYGQVGQTITYTYVITNTATTPLGPAQFTISDNRLGAPFGCGPDATTIAPSQSLTCSAPFLITQADLNAANVTNSATASGAGQTSASATATITNQTLTQTPTTTQTLLPPSPSNLSAGSTIQHQVAVGEWLIQIVRCYGATYEDVRNANPQISDPDFILPAMIVSVPRIGSAGRIYGPPCITFHTVQGGDTWASIMQRYNADLAVLQKVNPVSLTPGTVIKIPLNSAGSISAVTAVPSITLTPANTAPIRITLEGGKTTDARIGIINPNETIHYVLSAAQGQVLGVKLTAPVNEVAIGVNGPSGLALKPLDASPSWNTTITAGGDHFINIASISGTSSKSYTLEISLTTPAVPPTSTNTATP